MDTHKVVRHTEPTWHGVPIGSTSSQIVWIGSQTECWEACSQREAERRVAARGTSLNAALQRATQYVVEKVEPGDKVNQTPAQ